MIIRLATIKDLDYITNVEKECFPVEEAATRDSFEERLHKYSDHFWLLEDEGQVIGFINGMVSDRITISDDMFEDVNIHNENGEWQALFGVAILPEYIRKGYVGKIMERVLSDCKKQNRKGCILTCKKNLVNYYEKFGFKNYGVSDSVHGGEVWYDMRIEF